MNSISRAALRTQIHAVWRLSLPAILTQITTILMQYIDSAMVGALGAQASASIGLVSTTTWLFHGVINAVTAGFSVQTAHRIGAGEDDQARNIVRHGLGASLVIALLLMLTGIAIHTHLPGWLGGEAAIRHDAASYFLAFALMLPFLQLNAISSSFLQCSGDMVTPSILNAAMCALDVAFNALLIPRLGVFGAGLGTMLACAVVSLMMAARCCLHNPHLRLNRPEKGHFDAQILKKALQLGTPVALQEISMNGAQITGTRLIAPLGASSIAANSFAVTAEALCYMPGYGIGTAAAALVGRCVGAGQSAQAKRYSVICTALGAGLMGLTGAVMFAACPLVFRVLTPDAGVRVLAAQALRIGLLSEPLCGASIVGSGALRGAGDTLLPSLLNLGSIWLVRLGLAVFLVPRLGLRGMWTAIAVELCVRGLLMLWRMKTTKYYDQYAVKKSA